MLVKIEYFNDLDYIKECCNINKIDIITISYKYITDKNVDYQIKKLQQYYSFELCIEMDDSFIDKEDKIFEFIDSYHCAWLQFKSSNILISLNSIKRIQQKGIKIIYKSINSLNCDQEPYWMFPAFSNDKNISYKDIYNMILCLNILMVGSY